MTVMKIRPLEFLALICLFVTGTVFGHPDDPKVKDRQPRYEGPGFRLDIDGNSKGKGGIAGVTFPATNLQLMSWLPLSEFGNHQTADDCWGYTSPSGREYAIIGLECATGFVEVTNPGNAQIVAIHSAPCSIWHDIKVYKHHAYAVSEGGNGIKVYSMENIDNGIVSFVNLIEGPSTNSTHNVAINTESGHLYRCGGGSNGFRIYSLANPANPTFVGSWQDRYVHDAQIVNYPDGREIAFCNAGLNGGAVLTGLTILDVTDKDDIIELTHAVYPTGTYSHQGWLSWDRQFFYLGDELDESTNPGVLQTTTYIFDVSTLTNPSLVSTFTTGKGSIDHNLYVRGNYIFEANYRSGMWVFDATNPTSPQAFANFDTYPDNDSANYNGMWSNYPFLPSGTLIGSDIEKGLFVWQIDFPLSITLPNGPITSIDPDGDTFAVEIADNWDTLEPGTATLHYDTGSGFVAVPLQMNKGGGFTAVFPAIECGTDVQYYVSAQGTDGVTVYNPQWAPQDTYNGSTVLGTQVVLVDDMEIDRGWTVGDPSDTATDGFWELADPEGKGGSQPEDDHTPDGTLCWITGASAQGSNDVDGGATTLTSPRLNAIGGDIPFIHYSRWYFISPASHAMEDPLNILISNDDGQSWVTLESVDESTSEWQEVSFRIDEFLPPTDEMRLQFIARDIGAISIVEAGVDDLFIDSILCSAPCPPDLNGDFQVNVDDLLILIGAWGTTGAADLDTSGIVNVNDLLILIGAWGPCP